MTMLDKKKSEYEQQMMRNEELAGQNVEQISELKIKVSIAYCVLSIIPSTSMQEDDINNLKQEIARINKLREGIQRKLRGVEEQKAEIESKRESLKQQMVSLERGTIH